MNEETRYIYIVYMYNMQWLRMNTYVTKYRDITNKHILVKPDI